MNLISYIYINSETLFPRTQHNQLHGLAVHAITVLNLECVQPSILPLGISDRELSVVVCVLNINAVSGGQNILLEDPFHIWVWLTNVVDSPLVAASYLDGDTLEVSAVNAGPHCQRKGGMVKGGRVKGGRMKGGRVKRKQDEEKAG